jgi:cell division cycle 14
MSGADFEIHPDAEVVTMRRSRHTHNESESEEEFQLRMLARRTASRSPASGGSSAREKRRAVSCTTTTVTTWGYPGTESEGENMGEGLTALRPKTSGRSGSGVVSGKGDVSVGKMRSTEERKAGVRKTSGRVGSMSRANAGVKAE